MSQAPGSKNWLMRVLGFGPYFRRRTGGLEGIAVAAFIGVISGYYIFNPLLEEMAVNRAEREAREAQKGGQHQSSPPPSQS